MELIQEATVRILPLKVVLYLVRAEGGGPETTLPLVSKVPP
jgi:hypothetical protein